MSFSQSIRLKLYRFRINVLAFLQKIQFSLKPNLMYDSRTIKITNSQRNRKVDKQRSKLNHQTPEKYFDRESMCRTMDRMEKKFGYDYDPTESKTLKHLRQEFINDSVRYFGNKQWTKKMGRKQKYEKNIELGKPLKQNPLVKIFNKVQRRLQQIQKRDAFAVIKKEFK